jgi:hypothetical protein
MYENILLKEESGGTPREDSSLVKKVVQDFKLNTSFMMTYGVGISGFIGPVTTLLQNKSLNITEYDVTLLLIVAFYILLNGSKEEIDLYKELFNLKKIIFNTNHNIKIKNYDVELYAQDSSEAHFSTGEYSVLYNEWIREPKKESKKIDVKKIKHKAEQWMDIIDGVIENASDEDLEDAKKLIKKYKDKLKKFRQCGLEKGGEYSIENLVFKLLRRNEYIQKLFDFENTLTDKKLSVENKIEE